MGLFDSLISILQSDIMNTGNHKNILRAEIMDRGNRKVTLFRNGFYEEDILVTSPSMYMIMGNTDKVPLPKGFYPYHVFFASGSIKLNHSKLNMEGMIQYHLSQFNKVKIDSVIINGMDFTETWWGGDVYNAMLSLTSTYDYLRDTTETPRQNLELLDKVLVYMVCMYVFNNLSDQYSETDIIFMNNGAFDSFLMEEKRQFKAVIQEVRDQVKEYFQDQAQEEENHSSQETTQKDGYVPYDSYLSLYFNILELPKIDTSMREVKSQYRILSKKYHPDQREGNETLFRSVQEAYSFLREKFE